MADGFGNSLNNIMIGNNGDNRLDGGDGNDTMTGGQGNDTYVVKTAGDIVNELVLNSANGGVDTVESAITYNLAARTNIENLTLLGSGNINGTGNALANTILGNSGNNVLDGGTGADALKGGVGNDTYIVDNLGDLVEDDGGDSGDLAKTSVRIASVFAGVENYTYTGTGAWSFTGDGADNKITGGSGNDTLIGLGGNDWLDGGLGNDKMKGGIGNDTYVINSAGDVIDEEGNTDLGDLVRSTITVNLALLAGGAIENALLLGAVAINATGNGTVNELTGNDGANTLDGQGGADVMSGGKGADTYVVDNAGDQVIETIGGPTGGIDLVKAGVTYSLASLGNVENLTLTGSGDFNGTGNGLNNVLNGNSGANILDGGGSSDTMAGGKGDDTYVVNSAGDIVNETVLNGAGGGVDTVMSSVTFTLATRTNIEHLVLTGGGAINGTGNALDNHITGNSNNNTLDGGAANDTLIGAGGNDALLGNIGNDTLVGGDGNDKMTGGAGNDTFDFNLVAELGDVDTITDFTRGADKLDILDLLNDAGYAGVHHLASVTAEGYLSFVYSGTGGTTTNLWFDADGSAGAVASAIALASVNVHLTNTDTSSFIV
jgi:Ca2+-binding RTX toxin-like protein